MFSGLFCKPAFIFLILFVSPIFANAYVYNIGPNQQFKQLSDFDWDSLQPGDVVKIHFKKGSYREKLVLRRSGTKKKPIIIRGVADSKGRFPVIDGEGARHFQKMCGPKYGRGLITLGDSKPADYIIIDGLELRNANNSNWYLLGKNSVKIAYPANAAGIFIDKSASVKIRKCVVHSCGIGIITSYYPDVDRFVLSSSLIYDNGKVEGERWGHNVYIGARETLIQFNRFGELHSDGNNVKDRSQHTIIRYNWIEGGMSRQIDLVEYKKYKGADAYVYGNVVIQGRKILNPRMIVYGGDVGGSRGGTLYFFNNTVYAKTRIPLAFFVINRPDCKAILRNNVILGGKKVWMGSGQVSGSNNFVSHGAYPRGFTKNLWGGRDQFVNHGLIPYFPTQGSLLINRGTARIPKAVKYMPLPFPGGKRRPIDGSIDIGAYERMTRRHKKSK